MEIIKLKIADLTPYENNAKEHPKKQIEEIKNSIKQFGFCDPVGIWGRKNIIVEGHGRVLALQEMGGTGAVGFLNEAEEAYPLPWVCVKKCTS